MFSKFNNLSILEPFFEDPGRACHLRELARRLRMAPATVLKKLQPFVKDQSIKTRKERMHRLYQANIDSVHFRLYKRFFTIHRIIDSGFLNYLEEAFLYPTIILFGSAAKGEDVPESDIDLLILTDTKKEISVETFEEKLQRKIQLFIMNKEEFQKLREQNPGLYNNILNGIILSGFVKVV